MTRDKMIWLCPLCGSKAMRLSEDDNRIACVGEDCNFLLDLYNVKCAAKPPKPQSEADTTCPSRTKHGAAIGFRCLEAKGQCLRRLNSIAGPCGEFDNDCCACLRAVGKCPKPKEAVSQLPNVQTNSPDRDQRNKKKVK